MPYENALRLAHEAKVLAELATDPDVKEHLLRAADALQDAAEQILAARTGAADGAPDSAAGLTGVKQRALLDDQRT